MNRKYFLGLSQYVVLPIVLVSVLVLFIPLSVAGAIGDGTSHGGTTLSVTAALDGTVGTDLDVPFIAQVPPGDWGHTQNCGQASALMVFDYLRGAVPTEQGIKDIDDWLFSRYRDSVNNYNGTGTTTPKLEALARDYAGFVYSYRASRWNLTRLKQEIDAGNPVMVCVIASYLSNRGYDFSGCHCLVAKGYTSTSIICNEPYLIEGQGKQYANNEFSQAMSAEGGDVVVATSSPSGTAGGGAPVFLITCIGIGAAFGAGILAYFMRRRLAAAYRWVQGEPL